MNNINSPATLMRKLLSVELVGKELLIGNFFVEIEHDEASEKAAFSWKYSTHWKRF